MTLGLEQELCCRSSLVTRYSKQACPLSALWRTRDATVLLSHHASVLPSWRQSMFIRIVVNEKTVFLHPTGHDLCVSTSASNKTMHWFVGDRPQHVLNLGLWLQGPKKLVRPRA